LAAGGEKKKPEKYFEQFSNRPVYYSDWIGLG